MNRWDSNGKLIKRAKVAPPKKVEGLADVLEPVKKKSAPPVPPLKEPKAKVKPAPKSVKPTPPPKEKKVEEPKAPEEDNS